MTHLLFIDDVMLLGVVSHLEWDFYNHILQHFFKVSGMVISRSKSFFFENGINIGEMENIREFLPFQVSFVSYGSKYLGYYIKLNGYIIGYWQWLLKIFDKLLKIFDKCINHWC